MSAAARIRVRVSPGAAHSQLVGRHGQAWKLRVAAPPEGGRANAELCRYLAGILGVRPAQIRLVAGAGGRDKLLEIDGLTLEAVERALDR
jgi:uncharacterized protein